MSNLPNKTNKNIKVFLYTQSTCPIYVGQKFTSFVRHNQILMSQLKHVIMTSKTLIVMQKARMLSAHGSCACGEANC